MDVLTISPPTVPGQRKVSSSDTTVTPDFQPISLIGRETATVPGRLVNLPNCAPSNAAIGIDHMVMSPDDIAAVMRASGKLIGNTFASAEPSWIVFTA